MCVKKLKKAKFCDKFMFVISGCHIMKLDPWDKFGPECWDWVIWATIFISIRSQSTIMIKFILRFIDTFIQSKKHYNFCYRIAHPIVTSN